MVTERTVETDVLVVGAGPGGAAAAYHLARHGIDVTLVERSAFPREKVCGDGLTPRAVVAMQKMGVDTDDPGFERVEGLRMHAKECTIELPWPKLDSWPDYGLSRTRFDFDQLLVERAQKAGARLQERTEATEPLIVDGWVRGAAVRPAGDREADQTHIRARYVMAADGAASRFATPAGVRRDPSRPLGIAARRYYRTSYHPGPWFEAWLDLWDGDRLLPGYGWLFPLPEGRINFGAGLLNTFKDFKDLSAKHVFDTFARMLPEDHGISEDNADGRILSGPLPMGLNRTPQAVPGMVLIGDAAGAVNPFNGEGISYAMETAEMAAELVHEALANDRPGLVSMYPTIVRERYGRYYRMGRSFARMIGKPGIMRRATKYMMPNRRAMTFAMRLLANLSDGKDGDLHDKLFHYLQRVSMSS